MRADGLGTRIRALAPSSTADRCLPRVTAQRHRPSNLDAALATSPQAAQAFGALGKTQQYAVILQLVTARSTTVRAARLRRAMVTLAGG